MLIKITIIAAIIICVFLMYAIVTASAPRNEKERDSEDKAQLEYLEKWRTEHPKYDTRNQKG